MKIQIAILPHGWVFVGYYSKKNGRHRLEKAKNIRRHLGGRGLAGVGIDGPIDVTLDPASTVTFESYIALLDCDDSKWEPVLNALEQPK